MKKNKQNKNKATAVEYSCLYCTKSGYFSIPKLSAHLDIEHDEVSELDKKELIQDLKIKINNKNKEIEKENLKIIVKENQTNINGEKSNYLKKYKSLVLIALKDAPISEVEINIINSRKTIDKLKRYLYSGLKDNIKIYLDEANIDYKFIKNINNQKLNKTKIIKPKSNSQKFKELKSQTLKILNQFPINNNTLKLIAKTKNYNDYKKTILTKVDSEYLNVLDEYGIEYNSDLNSLLDQKEKKYFDESKKSIIPIYTPMGNKR